jgi:vancomycin resistance protein VanJ
LALLAGLGCGQEPLEPRDPTPGAFPVLVQSFNVQLDRSSDEATVRAVGEAGADVVALQEVTPDWEAVIRERYSSNYPYLLFRTDPGSSGLAVLSRYPMSDLGFHDGPNGWHPAWHVQVETPVGSIQLLNVHLRSVLTGRDGPLDSALKSDEDHLLSIREFTGECSGTLATLIVGDFNEETDGDAVRYLENIGYRNALPLYRPGQGTWRYRSLGGQLSKALDHILFDGGFDSLNAWVSDAGHSDHLPVFAYLELPSE